MKVPIHPIWKQNQDLSFWEIQQVCAAASLAAEDKSIEIRKSKTTLQSALANETIQKTERQSK